MNNRSNNTEENNTGTPERQQEKDINYSNSSEVTNPIPSTATPPIPSEMPVR